jgi:hypothetical protein
MLRMAEAGAGAGATATADCRFLTGEAVRLGWRDTPQVRPCRLRRAIHGAQGPVNPPTPTLDSGLVALGERQAMQRPCVFCVAARLYQGGLRAECKSLG